MVIDANDASFDAELGKSPVPAVLEFFATWCGNCQRIARALDALAAEFQDRVRVLRVNAEENPSLVARFGVSSTPTRFALDGGHSVASVVGAQPTAVLREFFTAAEARTTGQGAPMCVPAEGCTLPTEDQPLRLAEFDELFATALRSVQRPDPTWLRLRLATEADARAQELTAREADCCDFFDFDVHPASDEVLVDVRVPANRTSVLDGLERQARTAYTRAAS